ncbi:anaerobic sulfite reductase subunit A [Sporobacter termitidis DSM 10068]|uniref:Anaerobic sulfite reductase subunit A n=1 Tax=Sporobacter termitidis DSM 10068 TaxID=1123282 RepID=A0A1M5YSF0_9FIRM|nr:anaerobic sulfite reductase subunit AsrA [Sporobacter termitidis]SHI14790.1 anaerobic sulfite reductase subunit A [Sporobacter termitidis DSM 10068]
MGYRLTESGINELLQELSKDYVLFAPKRYEGGNTFSGVDCIRYGEITSVDEIETDAKSDYSFKEILLPLSQTLFYFTEDDIKQPQSRQKSALVFLRSCDFHAVKRLDEIYLRNGAPDAYYSRLRERCRFVLIGCPKAFSTCYCVDMGTNIAEGWDAAFEKKNDGFYMSSPQTELAELIQKHSANETDFTPSFVAETPVKVTVPDGLSVAVAKASMWREYDSRCIACGRCNFACPTCTCFSMQDVFYQDNGKVGERRRVQASCMVDGFTDVAGGGSYRQKNGDRMRFKTLHKVCDFKKRFGYHMCVGCGRCDDICPEYISFSHIINRLGDAMKEVNGNG